MGLGEASRVSIQSDWETQRVYMYANVDVFHDQESIMFSTWRMGWAPYRSGFNALSTWFIFQLSSMNDSWQVMPVLRLYKDNKLMEVGWSGQGRAMLVLMKHW